MSRENRSYVGKSSRSQDHCCKVSRVGEVYAIPELDQQLVSQREEDKSLRELSEFVNTMIVKHTIEDTSIDVQTSYSDVRSLLAGNSDLGVAERERIQTTLDQSELDIEAITSDFVSHESVRLHLNEHLDIDTSRQYKQYTPEETREMIDSIESRDQSIFEQVLSSLHRDGHINIEPKTVTITTRVSCSSCDRTYLVDEFVENGGCLCQNEE